jgi:tryptophan halogenase
MQDVRDVTIVGGSDTGLVTALALREFNPDLGVRVVDDFDGEHTDVAKSTIKSIVDILHNVLEIDQTRLVTAAKPVFKTSLYLRDWCGYPPFHYPFDLAESLPSEANPNAAAQFYHLYDEIYPNPEYRTGCEAIAERGASPFTIGPNGNLDRLRPHAYQFNTRRLNAFLREVCEERGIDLVNDRVTDVHASGGRIDRVEGEDGTYESDLYVDSSGFNRLLRRELDDEFRSFDFPLDSAFNTRIERDLSEVIPATVVETGDYGWFWLIDTYEKRDFGYVYSSEHVSDEAAREEFLDHCGIEDPEHGVVKYEFDSGYYPNAWMGNCVAIGNAGGFVEPLESTQLTANASMAINLSSLLSTHGRVNSAHVRRTYNGFVQSVWQDIYDFIFVHYKYSRGDNEFWEAMQSLDGSARVQRIVEQFDGSGLPSTFLVSPGVTPTGQTGTHDGTGEDAVWSLDYPLFSLDSYYCIMRRMGAESSFYEENPMAVSDEVKAEMRDHFQSLQGDADIAVSTEEFYRLLGS